MRRAIIAAAIGITIAAAAPARAGGVLDNKEQVLHFLAGMMVQEWREDQNNEQRRQEEQARTPEPAGHFGNRGPHSEPVRKPRPEYKQKHKPGPRPWCDCEEGMTKMQKLFRVHDQLVREVLEDSYESTDFVLDIHENNGYRVKDTARDIRPFVMDYFDAFGSDRQEMFDLWVETKFTDWLEGFGRAKP